MTDLTEFILRNLAEDPQLGCFEPLTREQAAALPRCATCGGAYPTECPPHVPAGRELHEEEE